MWFLSALKGDLPDNILKTKTLRVSNNGKISVATARAGAAGNL
jgi:hypothetical protein